jgi:hypothetical protein
VQFSVFSSSQHQKISFPGTKTQQHQRTHIMNHAIRFFAAALLLCVAACSHKPQPPVTSTGKTIVPVKR